MYTAFLCRLGFNRRSIELGSYAAEYESCYYTYGETGIPHDSLIAIMQSSGARLDDEQLTIADCFWGFLDLALGAWGFYILGRQLIQL